MNTMNIDGRWIGFIFLVLLLIPLWRGVNLAAVPVLAIAGGWMIHAGIEPWRSGRSSLSSTKVTYWRGQRIVTKQPARARLRSVSGIQTFVSIVYLVLGLGMIYAAIYLLADLSNLF